MQYVEGYAFVVIVGLIKLSANKKSGSEEIKERRQCKKTGTRNEKDEI